jgi:hypothetical protein
VSVQRPSSTGFPLAELALIAALRGDPQAPVSLRDLESALERHPPRGAVTGLVDGLTHWAAARQPDITPGTALPERAIEASRSAPRGFDVGDQDGDVILGGLVADNFG